MQRRGLLQSLLGVNDVLAPVLQKRTVVLNDPIDRLCLVPPQCSL